MNMPAKLSSEEIRKSLQAPDNTGRGKWLKWIAWASIAVVALIVLRLCAGDSGPATYRFFTEAVSRGDLTVTVTATGTLERINQADIGSELSGTIRAVNVDVNDKVHADRILAVMDTTRLSALVLQTESALASARAQVAQNLANVKESKENLTRLTMLYKKGANSAVSEQDLEIAEAGVARSEANLQSAHAAVRQAEASKIDLDRAEIRSPINGIVLNRSIEPGQTVAGAGAVYTG
jgi:HlyD family secretion protein